MYSTQISVIDSKKGGKVVGIEAIFNENEDWILVTTSDSRLRLLNLRDKSLIRIYKGF